MKKILVFVLMFVFITLGPARADLSNPSGLTLSSTSTTITVTWTQSLQEIEGFLVTYSESESTSIETEVTINDEAATSYTITGLTADTKYIVTLSVYNGSDESSGTSDTISTTDLDVSVELVAEGTIRISVGNEDSNINSYDVYVGTTSATYNPQYTHLTVDVEEATTISGLADGTYYILVDVTYSSGNTGSSGEIEFDVGDFSTFFSQAGEIENGCFIGSSSKTDSLPWALFLLLGTAALFLSRFRKAWVAIGSLALVLTVLSSNARCENHENVQYNNLFGIKAGLFQPEESLLDDTYDSIVPISLFYERMFGRYLSVDVSAGFTRTGGNAVTSTGTPTGVDADLDLIPISGSININIPVHPLITLYLGAGGDYWRFEEDYLDGTEKNDIGGYHGKAGVKLFTEDSEYFKKAGILLEASYTVLDRFGDNEIDLGGWTYSMGVMYCF